MTQLERIICHGNRTLSLEGTKAGLREDNNKIRCADGFTLSVIAGGGTYCTPRPDWPFDGGVDKNYRGPYTHVEVGFPSEKPEPWDEWKNLADDSGDFDPTDTVYGYVPVELVRSLVEAHGGEETPVPISAGLLAARRSGFRPPTSSGGPESDIKIGGTE